MVPFYLPYLYVVVVAQYTLLTFERSAKECGDDLNGDMMVVEHLRFVSSVVGSLSVDDQIITISGTGINHSRVIYDIKYNR
jgi:hypothetical protein